MTVPMIFATIFATHKYACIIHMWLMMQVKISKYNSRVISDASKNLKVKKIYWRWTVDSLSLLPLTKYDGLQHDTRVAWTSPINRYIFLCTRYPVTALLPTQFMSIRTHHKHQYSQHLNSTNSNTKPAGLWLIGFAVIDIIYIPM